MWSTLHSLDNLEQMDFRVKSVMMESKAGMPPSRGLLGTARGRIKRGSLRNPRQFQKFDVCIIGLIGDMTDRSHR